MANETALSLEERIRSALKNSSWEDGISLDALIKVTNAANSAKVISILRNASWAKYELKRCLYLPTPEEIRENQQTEAETRMQPASNQERKPNPAPSAAPSTEYNVFRVLLISSGTSGLRWEDICSKLPPQERPAAYKVLKYAPWIRQVGGRYFYSSIEPGIRVILSRRNASLAELAHTIRISDLAIMEHYLRSMEASGQIEKVGERYCLKQAHKSGTSQNHAPEKTAVASRDDSSNDEDRTRFALRDRILQDLKVNRVSLLGQIRISAEEYRILLRYTKNRLSNLEIGHIVPTDILLSVALVQIAIRNYGDEKYWYCISRETGVYLSTQKLSYVGRIFLKTVHTLDLFTLTNERGANQQYVENIKAHAFVTNAYLQRFFEFSAAYYERNLFRDLSPDIRDDLEDLAAFMRTTLSDDGDTIIERDQLSKTAKFYRLLKSTRSVFAYAGPDSVYDLFYPCLQLLDKFFYDDIRPQKPVDRFEEGFLKWCDSEEKKAMEKSNGARNVRTLASRKPYLSVSVYSESISIVIPPQKFRPDACDGAVSVTVTVNGRSITNRLSLYRSFGIYVSEELRVPIQSLFDEVDICISALAEKRLRIPAQDYRIFNPSWNSIPKLRPGQNHLLVKKALPVECQQSKDLIESSECSRKWDSYSFSISDESVIFLNGRPLSIVGEYSPDPVFENPIQSFSVKDNEGHPVVSAECHPLVSFLVDQKKLHGTALLINAKRFPLESISEKSYFRWPKDPSLYVVSVDLASVLPLKDGGYQVILDVPSDPPKSICEYLILRDFQCSIDKDLYIYDQNAALFVLERQHAVTATGEGWRLLPSNVGKQFSVPLRSEDDQISFQIDNTYWINLPIHVFRYGFSQKEMRTDRPEYLWYADLGETLYLMLPGASSAKIRYSGPVGVRYAPCTKYAENCFRADLSGIKHSIHSGKNQTWHELTIIQNTGGTESEIPLPSVLRKLDISPYFRLQFRDGVICCNVERILGDAAAFLTVVETETDIIAADSVPITVGNNPIPGLSTGVLYRLQPYMEESDEFGFLSEKTPLAEIAKTSAEDWDHLEGCELSVCSVQHQGKPLKSPCNYYIVMEEKLDGNRYLGSMYGRKKAEEAQNRIQQSNAAGSPKIYRLGKTLLDVSVSENGLSVYPLVFSYIDETWKDLRFDLSNQLLLHADDWLLSQPLMEKERFIILSKGKTSFIINPDRIRRIHYAVQTI